MHVTAVQFDIAWEDKTSNFQAVRNLLDPLPPHRGELILLPEMFATGFSMNTGAIAETAGGTTEEFLSSLARTRGAYVVGGAAVRGKDGECRNKALVFGPDGNLVVFYAKMRLFSPGGESQHYRPGRGPVVFTAGECRVAPFICYDLRFPELFRKAADIARPELYVVIASWPEQRISHWLKLLQARAVENQAYVIGVNRIGADPLCKYNGHSLIVDPQGEILADAGSTQEMLHRELDLQPLWNYRKKLPFLDDMTPALSGTA